MFLSFNHPLMITEISLICPKSCAVVILYHMNTFPVVSACLVEGIMSRSVRAGGLRLNKRVVVVVVLLPPMSITIKGPTLMKTCKYQEII